MINTIVFSKDRPAQLDLFMRTSLKYTNREFDINVLYTWSNDRYKEGYDILMNRYSRDINFVLESNFKDNLINIIDICYECTVFFVDDIIFKKKFSTNDNEFKEFENSDDILCLSLRLHPDLTYCYAANIPMRPTKKTKYIWSAETGDYSYPMSLDGHIFKTIDIYKRIETLDYNNPNSLESILSCNPIHKPLMSCYEDSIVINNACNKVQTDIPNRHGNTDANYLNDRYLEGYIIDDAIYGGVTYESCHKELPVFFVKL